MAVSFGGELRSAALAALLGAALCVVLGAVCWWCVDFYFDRFTRTKLPAPAELVLQDPATLGPALGALSQRSVSGEGHHFVVSIWGGDDRAWVAAFHNHAVRQGWYPHTLGFRQVSVIVPVSAVSEVRAAAAAPYLWFEEEGGGGGPAVAPGLGPDPVHIGLTVEAEGFWVAVVAMVAALLVGFFALVLLLGLVFGVGKEVARIYLARLPDG